MNADTYVSPSVEGAVCKNLPASAVESVKVSAFLVFADFSKFGKLYKNDAGLN